MSESDWRYHLTSRAIAQKIKSVGMSSNISRIGMPVAAPKGAFNQDRLTKEPEKQKQKLLEYLGNFLARGVALDVLRNNTTKFSPLPFTPTGNNEVDTPRLSTLETQALGTFERSLRNLTKSDWRKAKEWRGKSEVQLAAENLLRSNKNHFLVRLAVQMVAFTYKIEETITSSNIYFFLPKYADVCFRDYTKHLNTNDLVVLRVHKTKLVGEIADDSEFRAVMTPNNVAPANIEVMQNTAQFTNQAHRTNNSNWQPIYNWA